MSVSPFSPMNSKDQIPAHPDSTSPPDHSQSPTSVYRNDSMVYVRSSSSRDGDRRQLSEGARQLSQTSFAASPTHSLTPTPALQLPPLIRRIVAAARTTRPTSYVSTQEMKLAMMRRETEKSKVQAPREEKENPHSDHDTFMDDRMVEYNPSSTPSPISYPDLGPIYSQFQHAAQTAAATLLSGKFPGRISTAFERTSYWKRAPPSVSQQLGTIAWLFAFYALPRVDLLSSITTVAELESDALRLTWRQWEFLCSDWKIVPEMTSKNRIATLYQRYGVEGKNDTGMNYISFVKSLAVISLEANVPPRKLTSHHQPATNSAKSPTSNKSITSPSSSPTSSTSSIRNQNVTEKCLSFLTHLQLNNIEYVSSGLESLHRLAWYRIRSELTDAKSVYIHKPSCLHSTSISAASEFEVARHELRARPCACSQPPAWGEYEKKVVEGVTDRTKVLHLNPHKHATHNFQGTPVKPKSKPSVSDLHKSAMLPSSTIARSGTSSGQVAPAVPSLSATVKLHTPDKKNAAVLSSFATPVPLTRDEQMAFKCIRTFERLPLEDNWCHYPGAFIDMGVIEVLPPLSSIDLASPTSTRTDCHGMPSARFRPHRYHLELKNIVAAGLKVTISSRQCEWLSLEYKSRSFLALGLTQRLNIRAPTHMPEEDRHEYTSGIGTGVEKMGFIRFTVENSWTYEVGQFRYKRTEDHTRAI